MPLATVETPHTKFGTVLHRGQRRSDRERRSNKKDEYVYTEDEEYDMHESPQKEVEVRGHTLPCNLRAVGPRGRLIGPLRKLPVPPGSWFKRSMSTTNMKYWAYLRISYSPYAFDRTELRARF